MDLKRLNSFLKFGYFLDYDNSKFEYDLKAINRNKYKDATEEELIRLGIDNLKNAIHKLYRSGESNVVPLSGGLDSRAILAGLLECTDSTNIKTYTFGTPGTLDYDIGNRVAKVVGTKHTEVPFNNNIYTLEELIEISNRTGNQTVLFSTIPLKIIDELFGNSAHWTGAFAGPPSGNVLLKNPSSSIDIAKERFINHKYTPVKSVNLNNCSEDELKKQLAMDFHSPDKITFDEQLHMNFAQKKWIAPHLLVDGHDYKIPFMNKDWIDFMFSIDDKYRINQNLYKKVLLRAYPKAFSIITKSNFGCKLNSSDVEIFYSRVKNKLRKTLKKFSSAYIDRYINYIDFNDGIRNREDLYHIVKENVFDLKQRKLVDWIDIEKIWEDHIHNKHNHADALLVLASLEIHYKARNK